MDSSVEKSGNCPTASRDLFGLVAVIAAIVLATLFACRPIANADMGYHLHFGKAIWQEHNIIDSSDELLYSADGDMTAGPGQWIDSDGKMYFVSANWGTQVILWPVWEAFGPNGLVTLKMFLVTAIFILIATINYRFKIPHWLNAGILIVIALAGYERFNIRPELFSYAIILGQFHLLLRLFDKTAARLSWPAMIGMVILQLLLVSIHSFFIISWFFTGLLIAQTIIEIGIAKRKKNSVLVRENLKLTKKLLLLMVILVAVSFINPWTWRLVYLPFELIFNTQIVDSADNPYNRIGEILGPFQPGAWNQTITLKAYVVALCISAIGAIAGLFQRRWALLEIIGIMFVQTLVMRRNIFLGSILMLPASAGCVWWFVRQYLPNRPKFGKFCTAGLGIISFAVTIFIGRCIIDNSLYFHDRRNLSFGAGISRLSIPIGPAKWINENKPVGRIWTDFDSSSNALFFIQPSPKLPVLTNTWATPLSAMAETLNAGYGKVVWDDIQRKYSPEIVLIKTGQANSPLLNQLVASKFWTPVFIDAQYAVFLKADGLNARLARRCELRPSKIEIDEVVENLKKYNDTTPLVLQTQATTFQRFGWINQAIELSNMVVEKYPDYHEAWFELGASHCLRGSIEKQQGKFAEALADFKTGKKYFQKCLELEPGYYRASYNINVANADINQMTLLVE